MTAPTWLLVCGVNAGFIRLCSVEQSVARIQSGGHSVPEAGVRRRCDVVHANLLRLATFADRLDIYSNAADAGVPTLVGRVRGGVEHLEADPPPAATAALRPLTG